LQDKKLQKHAIVSCQWQLADLHAGLPWPFGASVEILQTVFSFLDVFSATIGTD
jgi:hypothetical protein